MWELCGPATSTLGFGRILRSWGGGGVVLGEECFLCFFFGSVCVLTTPGARASASLLVSLHRGLLCLPLIPFLKLVVAHLIAIFTARCQFFRMGRYGLQAL